VRKRLDDQVVLRAEMTVEAAMRQSRSLHDFGNADCLKSFLPKQPACDLQDPLAIFGHLFATDFHFEISPSLPLTFL
jgi:hypothetical protein